MNLEAEIETLDRQSQELALRAANVSNAIFEQLTTYKIIRDELKILELRRRKLVTAQIESVVPQRDEE